MALEIKQSVKLSQQLVITPQLQQAIKLLQLSRIELTDLIQQELVENPCLEEVAEEEKAEKVSGGELHEEAKQEDRGHDHSLDEVGTKDGELKEPENFDWENYVNIFNAPGYVGEREPLSASDEAPTYENFLRQTESLHDHLLWQIHLSSFSPEEVAMCTEIIGNMNDDGYFTAPLEEVARSANASIAFAEAMLKRIQELDPLGVGARNLVECLLLQTSQFGENAEEVRILIKEHLPDLETHDYGKISKKTKLSIERVQELAQLISLLDPKPGRPYSTELPHYIMPDVSVHKIGDEYLVTLNDEGLPRLQISRLYRQSLMKGSNVGAPAKEYIQDRLRAAMWLIKSIHQRQRTLYRVTKSIVNFQRDFFEKGIVALRPLVLKDVAEDIEMHESTISRVTTNKFVHTPRGIFELKFFFNSGVHQLEGGGIAAEAVKMRIKKMIEEENPSKPHSDQEIAKRLQGLNIDIARRTVAKYREVLGISPSPKRRRRAL